MATELIAAGTGADDGYITVNNGESLIVFLRDPDAGAEVEYSIKDSAATYQLQDVLDDSSLSVKLEPGEYQFSRVDNGASVAVDYYRQSDSALLWSYPAATAGIVNTTTGVTIKAAAGAGLRNYITSMQIQTATLGGATQLVIRDGDGGTILWSTVLQTTAQPLINIIFPKPLVGSANTLLQVQTVTAVTGGVFFNAQGYSAP